MNDRLSSLPFVCELCQKGYSRVSDYENHLNSYDHLHERRRRDLKEMSQPLKRTQVVQSVDKTTPQSVSSESSLTAKRKFKRAFESENTRDLNEIKSKETEQVGTQRVGSADSNDDSDGGDYERYDPRYVTVE